MNKKTYSLFIALLFLCFISCRSGVESDAKKAAELTNKSIEQSMQLELKKAEDSYLKAQEIKRKYENHKKSEEFNALFMEYRDKGKQIESPEP